MKVKEESEKVGLKHNLQKTKIMASGPITSWQINGETVETLSDFILGGSKITADGDCSHEIKRHLVLGRKAMTNLDSILKNRDITLPTKVCLVKAMVFLVVMYRRENWTIKKAEPWRIEAFELWCWRTLESPLDCKEIQPVLPKGISPGCSLEGLMLNLKLQYFGHLMWRNDSLEKNPDAGKDWRQEEKATTEDEMVGWHHRLNGHELELALGVADEQRNLVCCGSWGHKDLDTTERLNWLTVRMFTFVRNYQISSKVVVPFCISTSNEWVSLFFWKKKN